MMKKNLFEAKFVTSLRKRYNTLIKEDSMDALADDLETEMNTPSEPISAEEADLEDGLSKDNPSVAQTQRQTMEDIKNEDQMLKDKIQARIEAANQEIIDIAEKVESFLSILNDPENPESIKYAMDNATENSPFAKVKKTCGTRIGRIAGEIAALGQELRALIGSTSVDDMLK
jgi:dGTP triphosphohydrolase